MARDNSGYFFRTPGSGAAAGSSQVGVFSDNALVNGAFDYWQMGTSVTVANAASTYLADQWYVKNSLGTNGVITYSQVTGTSVGSLYGASVKITTAPTAAQTNGTELYQVLSNKASLPLYNQTASFNISVKALGNVTQVGVQFYYKTTEAKVDTSIGSEILTTVNTATFVGCQIAGQALGTSQTTAGVIGVRIRITAVSSGNTYDLNNGFIAEQGMLNLGVSSASFARQFQDPVQELMACQYFLRTIRAGIVGGAGSATSAQVNAYFPEMRTTPSILTPASAVQVSDMVAANFTQSAAQASLAEATTSGVRIVLNNFSGMTTGRATTLSSSGGALILDARI